jgi:hypothetical protein
MIANLNNIDLADENVRSGSFPDSKKLVKLVNKRFELDLGEFPYIWSDNRLKGRWHSYGKFSDKNAFIGVQMGVNGYWFRFPSLDGAHCALVALAYFKFRVPLTTRFSVSLLKQLYGRSYYYNRSDHNTRGVDYKWLQRQYNFRLAHPNTSVWNFVRDLGHSEFPCIYGVEGHAFGYIPYRTIYNTQAKLPLVRFRTYNRSVFIPHRSHFYPDDLVYWRLRYIGGLEEGWTKHPGIRYDKHRTLDYPIPKPVVNKLADTFSDTGLITSLPEVLVHDDFLHYLPSNRGCCFIEAYAFYSLVLGLSGSAVYLPILDFILLEGGIKRLGSDGFYEFDYSYVGVADDYAPILAHLGAQFKKRHFRDVTHDNVSQLCSDSGLTVVYSRPEKVSVDTLYLYETGHHVLHCELYLVIGGRRLDVLGQGEVYHAGCAIKAIHPISGLGEWVNSYRWLTSNTDPYIDADEIYLFWRMTEQKPSLVIIAQLDGEQYIVSAGCPYVGAQTTKDVVAIRCVDNQHWEDYNVQRVVKKDDAKISPKIEYEWMTYNMVHALADIRKTSACGPLILGARDGFVLDPPRNSNFSYNLYGKAFLTVSADCRSARIFHGGSVYVVDISPLHHLALNHRGYTLVRHYNVGPDVYLSYYKQGDMGLGLAGQILNDKSAALVSLSEEQRLIAHRSILTQFDKVKAIDEGNMSVIMDCVNYINAVSTVKTTINQEELYDYLKLSAEQLLAKQIVKTPHDIYVEKLDRYLNYGINDLPYKRACKFGGDVAGFEKLMYRRPLVRIAISVVGFLGFYRLVKRVKYFRVLAGAFGLLSGYLLPWLLKRLSRIPYVGKYCRLLDSGFDRRYEALISRFACEYCRGLKLNCRWCDGVDNKQVVVAGVMDKQELINLSKSRLSFPFVAEERVTPEATGKLITYSRIKLPRHKTVYELYKDIKDRPIKMPKVYVHSFLDNMHKQFRFNSMASSMDALLTGLIIRQGTYPVRPAPGIYDEYDYRLLKPGLVSIAATTVPVPTEAEFLTKLVQPRKRKLYTKSLLNFHHRDPRIHARYDVFCKRNENGLNKVEDRKTRIICNPHRSIVGPGTYANCLEMRVMKEYWRLLYLDDMFDCWPAQRRRCVTFIHGMDTSSVADNIALVLNTFEDPVLVSTDIANFDASQDAEAMERQDFVFHRNCRPIYARAGWRRDEIDSFYRFACSSEASLYVFDTDLKAGKDSLKLLLAIFYANRSVFSGDPLKTSLGNTNRQANWMLALARKLQLLPYVFPMASGDDSLTVVERRVLDQFLIGMRRLYASVGMSGVHGNGMVLKDILVDDKKFIFLAKRGDVIRVGAGFKVTYHRDVQRLIRTGEVSDNQNLCKIPDEEYNYVIHGQLREQVHGDRGLSMLLQWREKCMPMKVPSKRTSSLMKQDSEWFYKRAIHMTTETDLSYCRAVDVDYLRLAIGEAPHRILMPSVLHEVDGCVNDNDNGANNSSKGDIL